jgi:hypothetical protein
MEWFLNSGEPRRAASRAAGHSPEQATNGRSPRSIEPQRQNGIDAASTPRRN